MRKKNVRIVVTASLFFVAFYAGIRLYHVLTDDFRIANITYQMPYISEWDIPSLTPKEKEEFEAILDQSFDYLGKGAQCYVFSSRDKNYVIKFFKFKHHKPDRFFNYLYLLPGVEAYQKERIAKHKRKLESAFIGYKLAFDANKKESGIITIHLNLTSHLKKQLKVKDKVGFTRWIDLDSTIFVVQHRAKPTQEVIQEALNRKDFALIKDRFSRLFDHYLAEYHQGIYDRDHCVMKNTGFIQDIPVHFDVGKLTKEELMKNPREQKQDLHLVIAKVKRWLNLHYPDYAKEVISLLEEIVNTKLPEKSIANQNWKTHATSSCIESHLT